MFHQRGWGEGGFSEVTIAIFDYFHLRHSRVGGNPVQLVIALLLKLEMILRQQQKKVFVKLIATWIPAYAGTTVLSGDYRKRNNANI